MSKRGKQFTAEDHKQVCFSFLEISEDPIVGGGQKLQGFWDRIAEHYARHRPARPTKSIESKWASIRKETTKFVGCYEHVVKLDISGITKDEILEKANDLYVQQQEKGEDFPYPECYPILKEKPRWMMPNDSLGKGKGKVTKQQNKRKSMENNGENKENEGGNDSQMESNQEGVNFVGGFDRPAGSKSSKEEARTQRAQDEAFKISAQAQKVMAETGRERLRILEKQNMLNMLAFPTDHLEPELREFVVAWHLEEMRKVRKKWEASKEQPQPSPTPSQPVATPASETDETVEEAETVVVNDMPSGQQQVDANVVGISTDPDWMRL